MAVEAEVVRGQPRGSTERARDRALAALDGRLHGLRAVLPFLGSLRRSPTEVLGVLALDARQAALGAVVRVAEGGVSHVTAEPREVFSPALERRASAIVLAHNHPSGNTEPSLEDLEFTRAMCEAGTVLGIQVLDHLVVARRSYVSLRERGLLIAEGTQVPPAGPPS